MGGRIRVLTANVWNGKADPAGLAEVVERLEVDVVAAQELAPAQACALEALLPHGRLEPATDFNGAGIALRRPARLARVSLSYRDAHAAVLEPVDWPELRSPVEILGVHIMGAHVWPYWTKNRIRRAMLRALLAYLDASPDARRLLVGDLNATPLFGVYRQIARRLDDAAAQVARREGRRPEPTWGPGPDAPRLLRIDHAFVAGLQVDAVRTVDLGADHSGLVVDISPDPRNP